MGGVDGAADELLVATSPSDDAELSSPYVGVDGAVSDELLEATSPSDDAELSSPCVLNGSVRSI